MQYILTEEEYKDLKSAADRGRRLEGHITVHMTTKQLQALCTKIAVTMPVKWGWGGPDPKPWGCLLTQRAEAEKQGNFDPEVWYCDSCPVQNLCPYPGKCYSK
jgi:hypothetical protein